MPKEDRSQLISIIENDIREHEEIRMSMDEDAKKSISIGVNNQSFVISMENGELMADQLMMNHGNKDDLFDLYDESDGTQRLFDLIPAYEVVKDGRVILIDEVDRSFHSKLTEEFVRRYFEITEGSACQMICTTHDLNLMTLNLLRKDEIWFAERDNEHSTRLYSLSEFKTRNDKSVLNDYIQGRYGAVPFRKRSGTAFADRAEGSAADQSETENQGYSADHDRQPYQLRKTNQQSDPAGIRKAPEGV